MTYALPPPCRPPPCLVVVDGGGGAALPHAVEGRDWKGGKGAGVRGGGS